MEIKRFRVRGKGLIDDHILYESSTTQECYEFLKKQDMGLNSYMVECVVDDIEVDADDFMEAFRSGESPGDLQFF
jgi:hypothetical protein